MRFTALAIASLLLLPAAGPAPDEGEAPSGDAVIRAPAGGSEIVIRTTSRLAGAIDSLTWGGREFIDSTDHGRQLQSACCFDATGFHSSEVFNPTEAGSRADHTGPTSSSRLLHLEVRPDRRALTTTTRMAFWLAPGEASGGHEARNRTVLSDYLLTKRVEIGHGDRPHVLDYDVTFTVPEGARHRFAQFEALTGYMPPEFSRFWRFDRRSGRLAPLDDGPGEQPDPVVLATDDGGHAMGIYAPSEQPGGGEGPTYGRFRFDAERVVKWNCVFRVRDRDAVPTGEYRYRMFVVVGTRDDVEATLRDLHAADGG